MRLAVIGGGLIGGSIARGIYQAGGAEVTLADAEREICSAANKLGLRVAKKAKDIGQQHLIIIASPPQHAGDIAVQMLQEHPESMVTDTLSVKTPINLQVTSSLQEDVTARWVPGHPLTGGSGGWRDSRADFFQDQNWVLCPSENNQKAIARISHLVKTLGANPILVSPQRHDHVLARTSHMTHLAACALQLAIDSDHTDWKLSGTALRDATRISDLNAAMWTHITQSNQEELQEALKDLQAQVDQLNQFVDTKDWDGLEHWFAKAAQSRQRLNWERWS